MKRRAVKCVVFLLLGAVVNVAVAWGCVCVSSPQTMGPRPDGEIRWHAPWLMTASPDWEATCTVASAWNRSVTVREGYGFFMGRKDAWVFQYIFQAGLPFRAMQRKVERTAFGKWPPKPIFQVEPQNWREGMPFPWVIHRLDFHRRKYLPLIPMWPGFAINTLFYAAILWPLFAVPVALRKRWRIKCGRCPACAYPVGGSPICTECGFPLPSARKAEGIGE